MRAESHVLSIQYPITIFFIIYRELILRQFREFRGTELSLGTGIYAGASAAQEKNITYILLAALKRRPQLLK